MLKVRLYKNNNEKENYIKKNNEKEKNESINDKYHISYFSLISLQT